MESNHHFIIEYKLYVGIFLFLFFLAAGFITFPKLISYFNKSNFMDVPDDRKKHKTPTPSSGGAIFILSIITTLLFYLVKTHEVIFIYSSYLLLITGYLDDRYDLSPKIKFLVQFIGATIILSQLHPVVISSSNTFNYVFSLVFIVGFTNAFNLIDGVDSLAGSYAALILSLFAIILFAQENYIWMLYCISLIALLAAFLFFNANPAKIFMGDTGSLFLGFTIAYLSLIILNSNIPDIAYPTINNQFYLILLGLLFFPIMDTIRVMTNRILKGNSPFKADRSHLHHWLLRIGLSPSQLTIVCITCTLLFLAEALLLIISNYSSISIVLILITTSIIFFNCIVAIRYKQHILRRSIHKKYIDKLYNENQLLLKQQRILIS